MPDVRKCAIYGCRGNSRDHKDLKFFNFPARDSPLYDTWLSICHESEHSLRSLKRPYICSNHFHPWHVGFRRLSLGAVPSLNLKAPPGFAEEELAWAEELAAAQRKKDNLYNLINQSVYEWSKRAQCHPEFDKTLCTSRRELQRIGSEIRNLLGATLTFNIDDYWLRKFRKSHLSDSDHYDAVTLPPQSLDLVEIIKSIDPNAIISSEEEIAILVDEEQKLACQKINLKRNYNRKPFDHCPPVDYSECKNEFHYAHKKSFKQTLEEYYGGKAKYKNSNMAFKVEKKESMDASQDDVDDDDDGCFDVYSEDTSGPVVMSEPIVETYQQALEHLKPLEDFALREENYRVIGLLSTLEIIFKNHRPTEE